MGRMPAGAKGVENQYVEPCEAFHAFGWYRTSVGAICDIAEAKAEHFEPFTVLYAQRNDVRAQKIERLQADAAKRKLRSRPGVCFRDIIERVIERFPNSRFD